MKIVRVVLENVNRSLFTRVVFKDGKTDNPIFYKVETYLDCLLVPEIYVIPNFVEIVRAVLEI